MTWVAGAILIFAACLALITIILPSDISSLHERRRNSTSLRRALLFVLLGPVLGVLVAYCLAAEGSRDAYGIPIAYFFSLIICAIAAPLDGVLAYVLPVWLRAPLIAIAGAIVAIGLCFLVQAVLGTKGTSELRQLLPIVVIGASSTGAASLLTGFCRRKAGSGRLRSAGLLS